MKAKGSAQDPLWYKDAIIYETHVKAFFDKNDDGIGDFQGLLHKLDYLQELGVTCLWLLPFFPSPLRDDGYDIASYNDVHPSYGTLADFQAFMKAAHERDLQVLIELVVNHTSDQHPWFQAARRAPAGSPERDFYVWSGTDQKYKEVRIIFTDTEKSNWAWDPEAHAYYWHRFFSHQPDLNFDNPAVTAEVIRAMQFWLDMGVDGLRLDAIPYLVERDGTNCENLPETHAVIRDIRRAMDEKYLNRLFLAEANQWPADVLQYFGGGEECHMAFHFPLMPRIFMALRLEDRHPITEILNQTPPIPDSCQWGLFLRNHDELTLEMVTDEERDYMYLAYSADPRMRINVGIRRRLAPLMDNNRRRIELLNSLLFSFPGTPIIYYGDEIGMGDNIYLGDRNGVRTPMQWTPDRNAGFSRANPARLYSPLIMDPVYGYEAINVEAQLSDPSSLLHWMRNMIALRKLFRVFGRGTLTFLNPENRKVLAYLRKWGGDQILCVANLSRFAQPVELDLSDLAGYTPVEMLGYTEFPQIQTEPYRLTLGPYGFLWFELQGRPLPPEIRTPQADLAMDPVITVEREWREVLRDGARERLEKVFLAPYLMKQRWFGAKSRTIRQTQITDWAWLSRESTTVLTLIRVTYDSGEPDLYHVPLAIGSVPQPDKGGVRPESIVCTVRSKAHQAEAILFDASGDDAACLELLRIIENNLAAPSKQGTVQGENLAGDDILIAPGQEPPKIARSGAEQSNSSIVFGKRILKLFRRIEAGPNPDYEIGRMLSTSTEFRAVPRLAGGIEYRKSGSEPATLALLQEMVPNQGDGWTLTIDELGRYYEAMSALRDLPELDGTDVTPSWRMSELEPPQSARDRLGIYMDAATTLGRRTAEMHRALASSNDPAFVPEPLTREALADLLRSLRDHANSAFGVLKNSLAGLPDDLVDLAGIVLGERRKLLEGFNPLERLAPSGARIRIHGDYHLGQVLRVENDFVILDFEGEPARPLAERRSKQPALKDVAGMLRSISYAAHASLLNYTARRSEDYERLAPWAAYWEHWTAASFLSGYCKEAQGSEFLPSHPAEFDALLHALLLDKALYEMRYELNNRPAWVRIPLLGIHGLIPG